MAAGFAHREPALGAGWMRGWLARWRPAAPILMLFAIGVGSVFALIFFGGVSLDREASATSQQEMAAQVGERVKSLESISHDYAWWDEAVENLAVRFSSQWAKDNLGARTIAASYPQVAGALVLDDADRVLYGFVGARELEFRAPLEAAGGLDRLAAAARDGGGPSPKPVHAMVKLGDTIYLAAASAVMPFESDADAMRSHPVLVLLTALDAATLAEIGTATRVGHLRTAAAIGSGEIGQRLAGADGTTLGYLAWVPPHPGQRLIRRLLVPILLVTVLLAVLALIALDQILSARRAAEANARLVAAKHESLQQAANLLGITVDAIDEGIVVMRNDGELRHWNRTYERMWRFPPGILRVGIKLQELIDWKLRHGGFQVADDELDSEEGQPGSLVPEPSRRRLYRDAEGHLIESRRFEMPDGQGQIGVTRDLTQAKRREQALIEAREQALIANRSKSEFLANVSHELRTPLNAIIGFSEVLEVELYGAIENERYRSYIRDIRKSGLHLLSLINDILDFSKIEAGKMQLRLEVCDCTSIVKDAVRQISHQAGEQGLTVEIELPAAPVTIVADSRALFRAMLNLLSNAVKFTPSGGRIDAGYRPVEEGRIAFTVRDTGIGIAEADIATALSPFGQIDSDMARRYRGTGLGLSIVKGIADLHDGSLDIMSHVGAGTTITLVIPDHRQRVLRSLKSVPREPAAVG
ncbi:MAG TPA: ATP-binding protein [Dongiaceae bacterium]|nr:ATP-binding protein [Dongiaceae bacterium]